jgi:hypothetical protein
MSIPAQPRPWPAAQAWAPLFRAALSLLLAAWLLVLGPAPASAGADLQRWTISDQDSHRWGLSLFRQPDPHFPSGWRLRLTALSPDVTIEHERPLQAIDAMGRRWVLANRSEELVPRHEAVIPQGSAQFDAAGLVPRPVATSPLRLLLPLPAGQEVGATLGVEVVPSLSQLPET